MRVAILATATVLALALTGCDSAPRQVGDIQVQGSLSSYNYYGEFREKQANGKERIYLLGFPTTVDAFNAGAHELPMSKTLIGAGPNKETIMVEQVKDTEASAILLKRLVTTFNAKNNASVKLP
jgi:hypothetical protein